MVEIIHIPSTGGWDGVHRCRVCRKDLQDPPAPGEKGFCPPCQVLYEQRQREGVLTEALDARWCDTLATWRGKPDALQAEPNAPHLKYRFEREGWLVFMQGNPGGLPDWVTVHAPTGEVRRFQDESMNKVLAALLGSWPTPAMVERFQPIVEAAKKESLTRLLENW